MERRRRNRAGVRLRAKWACCSAVTECSTVLLSVLSFPFFLPRFLPFRFHPCLLPVPSWMLGVYDNNIPGIVWSRRAERLKDLRALLDTNPLRRRHIHQQRRRRQQRSVQHRLGWEKALFACLTAWRFSGHGCKIISPWVTAGYGRQGAIWWARWTNGFRFW